MTTKLYKVNLSIVKLVWTYIIIDVVDNSGMRFYYINTARQYNAGIMEIGHDVIPEMIIPPKAANYTVLGLCPMGCTQVRQALQMMHD